MSIASIIFFVVDKSYEIKKYFSIGISSKDKHPVDVKNSCELGSDTEPDWRLSRISQRERPPHPATIHWPLRPQTDTFLNLEFINEAYESTEEHVSRQGASLQSSEVSPKASRMPRFAVSPSTPTDPIYFSSYDPSFNAANINIRSILVRAVGASSSSGLQDQSKKRVRFSDVADVFSLHSFSDGSDIEWKFSNDEDDDDDGGGKVESIPVHSAGNDSSQAPESETELPMPPSLSSIFTEIESTDL